MRQSGEQKVTEHYDRWPFPGEEFPGQDGLLLVRQLRSCLQEITEGTDVAPRIMDVGCGTGHTMLALARVFPEVAFLGVDISSQSLEIARRTAREGEVRNVTFEQADLARTMDGFGDFPIVLSLGVLHHIACRSLAFEHLVQLTANGGFLFLWLYGRHGRMRHNLNQMFLRTLSEGLTDSERISVADAFLSDLGEEFAAETGFYTPRGSGTQGIAFLQERPQWLADQMIPAFEDPVTLEDILDLFAANDLHFHKWLGIPAHLQSYTSSSILLKRFEDLPLHDQMLAIDYLIKPEYYFVTGKKMTVSGGRE